jgi:hypothetical protein
MLLPQQADQASGSCSHHKRCHRNPNHYLYYYHYRSLTQCTAVLLLEREDLHRWHALLCLIFLLLRFQHDRNRMHKSDNLATSLLCLKNPG